jgi:hypothetical protein
MFFYLLGRVVGVLLWDDPMVLSVTPTVIKALLFQSLVTTAFGFVEAKILVVNIKKVLLFSLQ